MLKSADSACRLNTTATATLQLPGIPDAMLACPGLATLCARAGKLDRLETEARARGDLVTFAAALLQRPAS